MIYKTYGRSLICFVLIFALFLYVSPLRAEAIASEILAGSALVPVALVAASVLIALGIMRASDPTYFDATVNRLADWLTTSTTYVVDGMIKVVGLTWDGLSGSYLTKEFVQGCWQWVHENGVICNGVRLCPESYVNVVGQSISCDVPFKVLRFTYYVGGYPQYMEAYFHNTGYSIYVDGAALGTGTSIDGVSVTYQLANLGSVYGGSLDVGYQGSASNAFIAAYRAFVSGGYDSIAFADGLVLGDYQSPFVDGQFIDISAAEVYQNYIQEMQYAPGLGFADPEQEQDKIPYLPVSIPGLDYESVAGQTQQEAQLGQTQLEFTQDQVQDQTQTQTQGLLQNILQTIIQIPSLILDGLGQILIDVLTFLFVPAEDFLQLKLQGLLQEFGYLEPIISLGDTFKGYLSGVNPTPPVIWIDLRASRWYPIGGRVKFIDLTWYADYKPTVDGILGAFLWLWFLWRMFQAAPGIVRGAAGFFGDPDPHPDSSFSSGNTQIHSD